MQQNEESKPGPETASVPRPSDAGRGAGEHRRSPGLEWLLARCGCAAPRDVLADLDDEVAAAAAASGDRSGLRDRAWLCWQVSIVCGYELRDSLQRWLGGRRSSWSLKPMLAARLAARSVRRQPAIPLAAAVTLGLGFGAAATIFSVFAGFGRSLPVPQGDRIVEVTLAARGGGGELGLEQFETWRTAGSFEAVTGFSLSTSVLSGDGMYATGVSSAAFTPGLLEMLRVPPLLGRLPARLDDAVVLSHTLWSGYFDADPDLIGRTVRVDGQPREVAAVMPEGFRFPFFESLWIPYGDRVDGADSGPSAAERRASVGGAGRSVQVVGRLAEGVSPERAEAELRGLLLPANRVGDGEPPRVLVRGFTEARGEGGKNVALIALLILVLALLLVSCSNVSNLLLTRALARSRTLSLHAALGADPGQVVLQLFAEALLISLFGAALGAGLAWGASGYIESTLAGNWGYYWMRVGMDARVLRFVLLLAVAVAVIAGALPALRVRRADIAAALKSESSGTLAVGGGWIGRALLGAQVTFSALALLVAMLVAAGLLNTRQVAPGFPSETVQVATVALTGERYESREARRSFRDRLARELIESSSIREVAFANGLPGLNVPFGRLEVDGLPVDPTSQQARRPVVALSTSAEFFDLFGVRLLAGRLPTALDGAGSEPICVVTADFVARRLIGSEELRQHEGPERLADAANSPRPTASADSDNVERHERPTGAALEEALDRRIRLQGVTPEGTWGAHRRCRRGSPDVRRRGRRAARLGVSAARPAGLVACGQVVCARHGRRQCLFRGGGDRKEPAAGGGGADRSRAAAQRRHAARGCAAAGRCSRLRSPTVRDCGVAGSTGRPGGGSGGDYRLVRHCPLRRSATHGRAGGADGLGGRGASRSWSRFSDVASGASCRGWCSVSVAGGWLRRCSASFCVARSRTRRGSTSQLLAVTCWLPPPPRCSRRDARPVWIR